jgi:alpha-1,2-mannosyltransferase
MARNLVPQTLSALREAAWLDRTRAVNYCRILAAISLAAAIGWIAASHGGLDPVGKPLGTDFISFWAASKLALSGHAAAVYDPSANFAQQQAVFPGADIGLTAFFYPPIFLLLCLPLAMLPYLASLCLWLAATGYAYWRVLRAFLGEAGRGMLLPILAFPAVLSNIGHGQNAFLTTALFGGGVLALRRHPILAGICFGALIFKPHLGIVIPFALIAGGRWKAIMAAAVTACALIAASLAMFGIETWRAFLDALPLTRQALEHEMLGSAKLQSVFAAMRVLHADLMTAYALQACMAALSCGLLVMLVRRRCVNGAEAPAMITAALLTSPFLFDYDLTLLAIPLAWIFREAQRSGFLSWEKTLLLAGFAVPALSRVIAMRFGLPLGPPVVFGLFLLVVRRGFLSAATRPYFAQAKLAAVSGSPLPS